VVTLVRRTLEVILVLFVVGVLGLAIVTQLAPVTGYGLFAVRSESMAPALAIGDVVVVRRVAPEDVHPGDVVTIQLSSGATVTHRVVSATPTDDGPMFATKGDANAARDPVAARAGQLRGLVTGSVPLLGFLLAMLAMPSGIAALFSIGAALLTAVWLLDEVEAGNEEDDIEDELDELRRRLETEPTPATS
jgi:signal peptidase